MPSVAEISGQAQAGFRSCSLSVGRGELAVLGERAVLLLDTWGAGGTEVELQLCGTKGDGPG